MLPGLVINGMDSGFCILATSKQHYASADVGHLLKQANLLLDRRRRLSGAFGCTT